jgi:septum formation protein
MMAPGAPSLILASGSAARRALLQAAGLRFTAQPAPIDEAGIKRAMRAEGATPDATALALATAKARHIDAPGAVVIGADQMLVCDGAWFDKPADMDDVLEHLLQLRGQTHVLVTAVTCWQDGALLWEHVARPVLTMRPFSNGFLEAYLALEGEACLDCVGAYRFEGAGLHLFERVEGEQAAILGLPLLPLLGFLRRHGVVLA